MSVSGVCCKINCTFVHYNIILQVRACRQIVIMKIKSPFLLLVFSLFMLSCESKIEDPARNILEEIRNEFAAGNYNRAKTLIDSVKSAHPKAYKTRREAEALRHEVLIKEKERDIAYFDSELQRLVEQRDTMLQGFEFSKNSKYQDVGVYSVPSQAISKNVFNSYLRATVKENGEAVITSFYRGNRIRCKSVKVSCGDVYVVAEEPVYSWTGKEYGVYVERYDFKRGNDGGLMDFIASAQDKVVVELAGERSFKYELRKDDVTAITKVKELSDVLLSISKCREMREAAQYSLDFLMKGNDRFKKDTLQTENGKVESEN